MTDVEMERDRLAVLLREEMMRTEILRTVLEHVQWSPGPIKGNPKNDRCPWCWERRGNHVSECVIRKALVVTAPENAAAQP